ncbi:VOC family protein [Pseudonocardia sp. ICBG1293]|uniref:VOC family protein n=1 Tax=Pseudonocardia sp. ICBG1293 TaxID=2844382 RepID=UPI001CCA0F0F|nr:VOC family protein [Pseudonocardia sp. ICBG1293]
MSDTSTSRPKVGMYAFRTPDPRRLGAFWAEVMSLPVSEHSTDDLVMLDLDHQVAPITWMFERDDSAGNGPTRTGLDLTHDDEGAWRAIADRAESAGATREGEHENGGVRWIAMTDPDGNAFRVFAPRPS